MATSRILSTYYIVLVFRSLVNPQYAPDRNHFPNTHRHAPSATTELCRRQHPALDFHNSTSTPQPQARAALCQKLARTLTYHAARATTYAMRCHQPRVWSNLGSDSAQHSSPTHAFANRARIVIINLLTNTADLQIIFSRNSSVSDIEND